MYCTNTQEHAMATKVRKPFEFDLFGTKVQTGDWVTHLCPVIHQPVITRVCDKHVKDGGLMVWFYSPVYGEANSEAGWATRDHGPFRKLNIFEIARIPASVVQRSDRFLENCYQGGFQ